jgi:polysaccharide export outer membrane protein
MLRKFEIRVIVLLFYVVTQAVFAFTPTAQQIQQLKNMPRAQQEALARQMGIDLSSFQLNSNPTQRVNVEPETMVSRRVDENAVSKTLAEQSAAQNNSKSLKPYGYQLFSNAAASFSPSPNMPVPADYLMGAGDSINIQLFGKESGQYELVVNNEGEIQIPELGPMPVLGLRYEELKQALIERYKQQMIGVSPHITMGTMRTIQVYIVGEAYRPGALIVNSLSTITHALFASGGVNAIGSLRNIELKRAGQIIRTFDLYDMLIFGSTENDIRLQQGDVIFIPTVKKLVSIDGAVRRPAIYEVKQQESLAKVIEIAGGLLPSAADQLQIARKTPKSELEVKSVSLFDDTLTSLSLYNGDFINVAEANKEFSNAIVIAGAYATPGLVQWQPSLQLSSLIKPNTLLNGTDLDYALILRREKFASHSQVIQFEPSRVLSGEFDTTLERFDQITLFNQSGFDRIGGVEAKVTGVNLEGSADDLKTTEADYLKGLDSQSFTESQLILTNSKNYSRKKLLAPIIARLKDEGSNETPVQLSEISGQVKYPGVYPIADKGKIKQLILAAGGFVESAYIQNAELSRSQINASGTLDVKHINVDLVDAMLGSENANLQILSKDALKVHRVPDWYDSRTVELVGEVVFPGKYQIKKDETLSQLLSRAGGFTSNASLDAVIFTREELKRREKQNLEKTIENLKQQFINSNVSGSQNVKTINFADANQILNELLNVEPVGRLILDVAGLNADASENDIQLKGGDKLYVPNISNSVSVVGEVFVASTHLLDKGTTVADYISRSGGLTEQADSSKVYIVKANGSVKVPNNDFWFGGTSAILEPGDTIVVPRDVVNYERLGLWQTVTQIVYQSAVALVAIGRL